jgi:V-type H+-transporting ATPase subunit a
MNIFLNYKEMQPARYELYRLYFRKERTIYVNLNKCLLRGNFIDGEVWIPEEKFSLVQEGLQNVIKDNHSKLTAHFSDSHDSDIPPPTYIKTNDLTAPFQEIVDTYGAPRYREVNPALFTIVTFPFLFGVMFGDIGHGLLLFLFALYLVLKRDDIIKSDSPLKAALRARYLLLFMGFFAFYSGWMYNDFLSLPLGIFGTCYTNEEIDGKEIGVRINENCVYPFGFDPKWYVATNELTFFNSLKMKLSVILGVIQMILGIFLKGMNAVYFKNSVDFIFEFLPQIVFMTILFGYMNFMIFIKWATDWSNDTSRAPSIITLLMGIFLKGGSVGPDGDKKPVWGLEDYTRQENFHNWVLVISLICVPLMLFPKPIFEYMKHNKAHERHSQGFNQFLDEVNN